MKTTLTEEEYENVKQLADSAMNACNKAEARKYIEKIPYAAYGLTGNANNILGALIACVKNASGQVNDKENKKYFVTMELYKLEKYVEE